MKAITLLASTSLLMLFASSCDQRLAVQNLTDPDIKRVFGTGQSIESTIGAGYQTVHNAMANTNNQPGVEVWGLESYSSLNNFNLGTRAAIPRLPINNVIGAPSIFSEFTALAKEARLIINALNALDELNKANLNTGSAARDMRARSFGMFVAGIQLVRPKPADAKIASGPTAVTTILQSLTTPTPPLAPTSQCQGVASTLSASRMAFAGASILSVLSK